MPETRLERPSQWPDPGAVCSTFGLGRAVSEMVPLDRAWSNRVFRLRVDRTDYLLKELRNPWRADRFLEWVEAAFGFEQAALGAGIRAPRPVPNPSDGAAVGWVARRDGRRRVPVRVHHFVGGEPCPSGPVDDTTAEWAGEVLAELHALGIEPEDPTLYPVPTTASAERWPELVDEVRRLGHRWAVELEALSPTVSRAARLAAAGLAVPARAVMSHGDIDQKNIVLTESGPFLCDWDVVAPWVPSRELVDVAVSMGAARRFDVARRVVRSYERASGRPVALSGEDLAPSLMIGLDWVVFNVERAVGLRPGTEDEVARSRGLVPGLLAEYRHGVGLAETIAERLAG